MKLFNKNNANEQATDADINHRKDRQTNNSDKEEEKNKEKNMNKEADNNGNTGMDSSNNGDTREDKNMSSKGKDANDGKKMEMTAANKRKQKQRKH
jgi:hypothetical protein